MSKRTFLLAGLPLILALLWMAHPFAAAQGQYEFLFAWGSAGAGDGQFNYPRAIAIAPDGNVYVADSENHRIQVFTPDGDFVNQWGSYGSGPGQFDVPQGIAIDAGGLVYVGDRNNSRIQKFTPDGGFILMWGQNGTGPGEFMEPRNIAVDANGSVYVADSQNHRIQKFTSNGEFITAWGGPGSGPGQFNYATGVAVSAQGVVYACDADNNRIQIFSTDGEYAGEWGRQGGGPGQFDRPYSVTVDTHGDVYVIDEWNNRIQKINAQGEFITVWGSEGSDPGQFQYPHGVAVSANGDAYVVDEWNHRVQVFRPAGAGTNRPTPAPLRTIQPPPLITPPPTTAAVEPVGGLDAYLSGQQGEVLYVEDFQDNEANGWTIGPEWFINQDPSGNYVLEGIGPGRADLNGTWNDLFLSFRLWINSGSLTVAYRPDQGNAIHAATISPAGAALLLRHYPDPAQVVVRNDTPLPLNTWLDVVLVSNGAQIQLFINGALWLDYVSSELPRVGSIGFVGPDTGDVWIDDVTVSRIGG
jgi:DNA-binding beta-propeller fold protein YncE